MTATIIPSGISTSMFFRLCAKAPWILSCFLVGLRRVSRQMNAEVAAQIAGGEAAVARQQLGESARQTAPGRRSRRRRAQIENVIGGLHHGRIVLDDENGVALVAQFLEDADEPTGVAAVQADGRLVEHIERADQLRAERGRQLDALRLAARERRGEPFEREVFEPHVFQIGEPLPDLLQEFSRRSLHETG